MPPRGCRVNSTGDPGSTLPRSAAANAPPYSRKLCVLIAAEPGLLEFVFLFCEGLQRPETGEGFEGVLLRPLL